MFLYFDRVFMWAFFIMSFISYLYKGRFTLTLGYSLVYPTGVLAVELVLMCVLFLLLHIARLYFGAKGNKTETMVLTLIFLIIVILTIVGHVFIIFFTTYV